MNLVFFSTPAYGHVNAVLPVLASLTRRGHRIQVAASERFRTQFEAQGCHVKIYPVDFENYPLDQATSDFLTLASTLETVNQALFPWALAWLSRTRADVVLHDSLVGAAKTAAAFKGLPAVNLVTTLAFNARLIGTRWSAVMAGLVASHPLRFSHWLSSRADFRRHTKQKGLGLYDAFMNEESLNLVFTPPFFQPLASAFDPGSYRFVGTTLGSRPADAGEGRRVVYVSLGTIFATRTGLLKQLIAVLGELGLPSVVVVGDARMDTSSLPPEVEVVPFANQRSVLARCDLFINHGGLNSVLEAIYHGVPQVCLPQQEEQRLTAVRAQELGLARVLHRFDPAALKREIQLALAEGQPAALPAASRALRSMDGTAAAVAAIESLQASDALSRASLPGVTGFAAAPTMPNTSLSTSAT